jgi:transposase
MRPANRYKGKVSIIRDRFIANTFNSRELAEELKLSRATIWRYQKEFALIQEKYPDKLTDYSFFIQKAKCRRPTALYDQVIPLLPGLVEQAGAYPPQIKALWTSYRKICPDGYAYVSFKEVFQQWAAANDLVKPREHLLTHIAPVDLLTLNRWRHSNNHRSWQIATTLKAALAGLRLSQIMSKTEATGRTIHTWLATFKREGLAGFTRKPLARNTAAVARVKLRQENLLKLLHETPKLHGLNRTSWSIKALTEVFNRVYDAKVSYQSLRDALKTLGYKRQKSRDMLTSQDPKFREKISKIQHILQHLGPKEKFFSIDEYGPVGMRLRGGTTLKHVSESPNMVPQHQKCKGVIICSAALELATNQVTHFYSPKKNTFETLKLIDLLVEKYKDQECLYLCWDAASWHSSKILLYHVEDINHQDYRAVHHTPEVKVVPLPTCTQFLNVIESVFAGLAKTVMHNSDYENIDAGKKAIDLYFEARNKHYLENPKHAGNKIWGKELVAPKFSETQQCKVTSALQGRAGKPLRK